MVNNNFNLDSNSLTIYHQNISGLKGKTDELISSMSPNLPHILCFSEHHLKHTELGQINIEGFELCTAHCRQAVKRGAVCIFIEKGLENSKIGVNKYCKDVEICMLNLKSTSFSSHIMVIIVQEIKQYQEKWLKHVQRMDTNRLLKQALKYKPNGRRNIGRPRKRWRDQLHLEDRGID